MHSLRQVRPGDAGYDCSWCSNRKFADTQDAFGVHLCRAAKPHDGLIACTFSFFQQTPLQPPDNWMEPKNHLNQHLKGCSEIIATLDVRDFVSNDPLNLSVSELLRNSSWPHQRGSPDAEDTGFK